jgi:hypothetical protein
VRRDIRFAESREYARLRRESGAADRQQAATIRRLGLPRSCYLLAGQTVFVEGRGS